MSAIVSGLYRYPLKSGAREKLDEMLLSAYGPEGDRMFMLVDPETGNFISQRPPKGSSKLALISTKLSSPEITFSTSDGDSVTMSETDIHRMKSRQPMAVKVHDSERHGYDLGNAAAEWFSEKIGMPCRLVSYAREKPRYVDPDYAQEGDKVGFADGMQALVTSTSSLKSLHELSATAHFGMDRFRPNIVIDGLPAWQEDVIAKVRIGSTIFEFVKPCTRCIMTTIDQKTGERDKAPHPYSVLGDLRKGDADGLSGRFFGQNAAYRSGAIKLKVGQPVEIIDVKPMHPALEQAALKYQAS